MREGLCPTKAKLFEMLQQEKKNPEKKLKRKIKIHTVRSKQICTI